jgi:predicted nuclease of predicted toxin-antitoxin system
MRLLLDQGLPRSSAALLREAGIDAIHVGELDMSRTPDESIIAHARANGFSIVTLDADFHSLIASAATAGPSVIRLRVQRLKAPDAARLVRTVLDRVGHELAAGCLATVTKESIRIRRLPIQGWG